MKSWITAILLFAASLSSLAAAENGGLLVDVQKVSLERHDDVRPGHTDVGRTMALKVNVRNNSMKEMPETTLKYVILVEKHSSHDIERTEGEVKLEKLLASRSTTVNAGEIKIEGHINGRYQYVDQIAGWKITIVRDGRSLDFSSGTNFDVLNKRANK